MAFKFYQTRPNTTKHDQTRSNSTIQGAQTVKCLVTKQCLMVFGRDTFIVCPGPKTYLRRIEAHREKENFTVKKQYDHTSCILRVEFARKKQKTKKNRRPGRLNSSISVF